MCNDKGAMSAGDVDIGESSEDRIIVDLFFNQESVM